jgi:hypothetical protein
MTQEKALGLFTLMVSRSTFARNLNAQLASAQQTPDTVWTYFLNAVRPLGIAAVELNRMKMQELWTDDNGELDGPFDADHVSVGEALSPPLTYDPGPCPDGVLVTTFMNRLP